jgi:phosphoserine phosphatase RsbU/P
MFVTFFIATYDARSGHLAYVRAGHIAPWLRRTSGQLERLDVLGGPPLGLIEELTYREGTAAFGPGDRFLAVTDGITEAVDPSDAQFGEARVEAYFADIGPRDIHVLERLTALVRTFEAGRPAFDDIAALLATIGSPA